MHGTGYSEFTAMAENNRDAGPIAEDLTNMVQTIAGYAPVQTVRPPAPEAELAQAARNLEASFLSVMLREAGVGAPRNAFGGGSGEEQFVSLLTDAYAAKIADSGGIGLAEHLFRALKETANGNA